MSEDNATFHGLVALRVVLMGSGMRSAIRFFGSPLKCTVLRLAQTPVPK
jgi:hypothetical protein